MHTQYFSHFFSQPLQQKPILWQMVAFLLLSDEQKRLAKGIQEGALEARLETAKERQQRRYLNLSDTQITDEDLRTIAKQYSCWKRLSFSVVPILVARDALFCLAFLLCKDLIFLIIRN
jgi:hypothetical protein